MSAPEMTSEQRIEIDAEIWARDLRLDVEGDFFTIEEAIEVCLRAAELLGWKRETL